VAERSCLRCGMVLKVPRFEIDDVPPRLVCPKCDESLYLQHDGKLLTRDIAHQRETVPRALDQLDKLLLEAWRGYAKGVRIVVGGAAIREQVLERLRAYRERGIVREYREDNANRGAIVAILRGT
jgi:hypothetical protein